MRATGSECQPDGREVQVQIRAVNTDGLPRLPRAEGHAPPATWDVRAKTLKPSVFACNGCTGRLHHMHTGTDVNGSSTGVQEGPVLGTCGGARTGRRWHCR